MSEQKRPGCSGGTVGSKEKSANSNESIKTLYNIAKSLLSIIFAIAIFSTSVSAASLQNRMIAIYGTLTSNYCEEVHLTNQQKNEFLKMEKQYISAKYDRKKSITIAVPSDISNQFSTREISELLHIICDEIEESDQDPLTGYYGDSICSSISFGSEAKNQITIDFKEYINHQQEEQGVEAAAKAVSALHLNQYTNDKDKLSAICNYVENIATYDKQEDRISNSVYGTLINHKAQCGGYTRTVYLMALMANIKGVRMISGDMFRHGGYHGWLVYQGYVLDPTNRIYWVKPGETYAYRPELQGNNTYLLQHTINES